MRKAIRASVLVLVLACSAHAGIMQNGSPQPPPPESKQEPTTDGEMHYPLVQLALDLFALI